MFRMQHQSQEVPPCSSLNEAFQHVNYYSNPDQNSIESIESDQSSNHSENDTYQLIPSVINNNYPILNINSDAFGINLNFDSSNHNQTLYHSKYDNLSLSSQSSFGSSS